MNSIFDQATADDSLSYYFPSELNDTFERKSGLFIDVKQKLYSAALFSLKEPILYNKEDSLTIYRLLLPSLRKPACFSMKEIDGRYFLNTKMLDRQPAIYPTVENKGTDKLGKEIYDTTQQADRFAVIEFETINELTNSQWIEIENYLSKFEFWRAPILDPNGLGGADGSDWIIEGRKDRRYHFIDRQNPHGEIIRFEKYLIKLGGLRNKEVSLY